MLFPDTSFFQEDFHLKLKLASLPYIESSLERTDGGLEFGFSNVLQIMSANAISTQLFFTRGFSFDFEISITFLYEKQYKQIDPFSKEPNEV